MNYFNEEHHLFRESLRSFLEKEVRPNLDKWESDGRIPRSIWKKMGDLGFLGLSYPEEYGGAGLDFFFDVVFNEEIGRMNSGGFAITQQVVQYMSGPYIKKYGSELLKQKYLPGIISGDIISCIGITEPDAGSDTQNITTKAVLEGDDYIVNGSKVFITNAFYGDIVVAVVRTNPNPGSKGISLLVIDLNSEGVTKNKLNKLGWHASDTAELGFNNVRVPKENLVGQEGKGFYYLMNGLQLERLCFIPCSVTAMEYALEVSLDYMSHRKAFGKTINQFQVLRHRIAQLASEVEALKSFSYYCNNLYDKGIYDVKLCSMSKLISTELQEKVATQCLQFFGGNGFIEDYPLARMYRDVRVGTIGAGTSEIMRDIIAKVIIDDVRYAKATGETLESNEVINPYFTQEHNEFRASLQAFLAKEVVPFINEWEEKGELPRSIFEKFGEMGYFGLSSPKDFGGTAMDIWHEVILHEELAKINSGGFAASLSAHFLLAMAHLSQEGSAIQKEKYLTAGNKGKLIGSLAITEPEDGSDIKAMQTTALKDGNEFVINGTKTFVVNGVNSDYIIVAAKTDPSADQNGISLVLVERETKGLSTIKLNNLGLKAAGIGEIRFNNVRVPVENLLGQEGKGYYYLMEQTISERLSIAAATVSKTENAIEITIDHMNQQEAFGSKISKYQVLRHRIAQMATELACIKQFLYDSYSRFGEGEYIVKEAAMIKLLATQLCDKVTFECLQMFGDYGYREDYPLARMWRDARINQIAGGGSEVLCEIISKIIIDGKQYESVTSR